MTMLDYTGREIHVGDRVAFPRRQGSEMWLTDAVVTAIDDINEELKLDSHGRLSRIDRCVVITKESPKRYYFHKQGFLDGTIYVETQGSRCVAINGRGSITCVFSVPEIQSFIDDGFWIEVSEDDAKQRLMDAVNVNKCALEE